MSVNNFAELVAHAGHSVSVNTYGDPSDPVNVAVECGDCQEVLLDYDQECEYHTWVLWTDQNLNECEECGATEVADPDDVAEQYRLLAETKKIAEEKE